MIGGVCVVVDKLGKAKYLCWTVVDAFLSLNIFVCLFVSPVALRHRNEVPGPFRHPVFVFLVFLTSNRLVAY
jgi:hypothetical protein